MRALSLSLVASLVLAGCAQFMAFQHPGHLTCRDDILREGVDRSLVVACLGPPAITDERLVGDKQVLSDTHLYEDGGAKNQGISKVGRTVLYTVGDVLTLFLTQLIWMPTEALLLDATKRQASIDYERGYDGRWRATGVTDSEVGSR
jgi:hypothetical protein